MKAIYTLAAAATLAWATACTEAPVEQPNANPMGLAQYSAQVIEGHTVVNNQAVGYAVETLDKARYQVTVNINENTLEGVVDYSTLELSLDGHGAHLAKLEKDALVLAAGDLYRYLNTQEGNLQFNEYSLVRLMEYWGNAPDAYVYGHVEAKGEGKGLDNARQGNEGITCIRKGTNVKAEYDDSRGVHAYNVRVNSKPRSGYGCMGRCGGDCGNWWIPSSWTKDCMDHDECSNVNYSSGGASDANCGDEFNQAADDWTFGVPAGCFG